MEAEGLELLAPGVGDGRLAAVGQHDRRAVGRVQGIQQGPRRKLRDSRDAEAMFAVLTLPPASAA